MQITFGMQLDGQRPIRPGNQLGSVTVGPQGLLEILETQLGLVALQPCAVQRAAAYRECIAHASIERPCGRAKGFLGQLQAQLQRSIAGEQLDPLIWQDDGTMQVVQAQTRSLAASWLSRSFTDIKSRSSIANGNTWSAGRNALALSSPCRARLAPTMCASTQGVHLLRPRQLQQMVEQATAAGNDNPLLAAQIGAQLAISRPGAAIEHVDTVMWQMVQTLVDHPKVEGLKALLIAPGPLSQPHRLAPLPLRKRWWKLPDRTPLSTVEKASFSSLNLLLFNPYQWLLQYGARIRPSQSLTLGAHQKVARSKTLTTHTQLRRLARRKRSDAKMISV
jgi:hypothetical protein